MARMYPDRIDEETAKSSAEVQLFRELQSQLSDDYVVFHHVAWQDMPQCGQRPRDGETDFAIAHPDGSVIILEVKGGRIRKNGHTGLWCSTDQYGVDWRIKDPFEQARDSKYTLLEKIKSLPKWETRWVPMGHAVAFPDVVVDEAQLGLDAPREIILDHRDMGNLRLWIRDLMSYWEGHSGKQTKLENDGVDMLTQLLARSWTLRTPLGVELAEEQARLIYLTEEQFSVLDSLSRHRRAAICGCAGSGKTMLAMEKAVRLAEQGFEVLLTCFGRSLAAYLQDRIELRYTGDNLWISNFHAICTEMAEKAGVPLRWPAEGETVPDDFFVREMPEGLLAAMDKLEDWRLDAIVVDEAQDFREEWWIPLQCLLEDPDNDIFYVFFDDNQLLYVDRVALPFQDQPYLLTKNCRNTQTVHKLVSGLYKSDVVPTAIGPPGRAVEMDVYTGEKELKAKLYKTLRRLMVDEEVDRNDIAVLTPKGYGRSLLLDAVVRNVHLADIQPLEERNQVLCTTVHNYKGLEKPVVILAEIDDTVRDLETILYVGCSRAQNHLILLAHKNAPSKVAEIVTRQQTGTRNSTAARRRAEGHES